MRPSADLPWIPSTEGRFLVSQGPSRSAHVPDPFESFKATVERFGEGRAALSWEGRLGDKGQEHKVRQERIWTR